MKKITILICAVFTALSFASCKKCTHCTVTDNPTGFTAYDYGEYCASSKEIKDYKTSLKSLYPAPQYTVSCTDK